jgi:5'-3' exonuclease
MYEAKSKKITIVSTDRDFYQLVNDQIEIWSPIKKKMYDTERILNEFGVHPKNYVIYRSFTGDKSDNIPGVKGIGPKTLLKHVPDLDKEQEYELDDLWETCYNSVAESKTYNKIIDNKNIISDNWRLMNLKLLDIPAQTKSNIRRIMESQIPELNKIEFRKLFMEDKMWSVMKNMPDWLNNTWLSLSAFAQKTK